ncbi:MAG: TonB-dependent receptor [Elusimicrobia bacterium]|nr:TonB-dependent receptor [Elusimicrobiota bacterium]
MKSNTNAGNPAYSNAACGKLLAAALTTLFCAAPAQAQDQKAASVGTVVVSATRSDTPLQDLPASAVVITAEELKALPGTTLDQKLASVPGLDSFRQNGIYSFSATVSMRGLGTSDQGRTLVLLNGVPVNTSATGSVNWNRLNIEDIERIEIIKGPGSLTYGADAAGGIINIVSRRPDGKTRASAAGEYGTYDTYSLKGSAEGGSDRFYVQGSGYYMKSDGYISTPSDQRNAYTTAKNALEQDAGLKAGYKISEKSRVDAAYSFYDGLRGEGTKRLAADGTSRRYRTNFGTLAWTAENNGVSWKADAYYQNERYGRVNEGTSATYSRTDTDGHRIDAGARASATLRHGDWLTLTPGVDFTRGSVDMTDTNMVSLAETTDRGKMLLYAPFVQAQAKALDGKFTALAGLRYDGASFRDGYYYNPTNPGWSALNGDLPNHDWHQFSPKLSAGWQYSDTAYQYASYAKGFHAPSLEDMCLSLQRGSRVTEANPNLEPETVHTWETGFRLNPVAGLSIEPAAYYTIGRDFMYSVNTGRTVNISGVKPIYQKQNVGKVEIYGADMGARMDLGMGFALNGSYTYTHSKIQEFDQSPELVGKALTYDPKHTVYLGAGWEDPKLLGLQGGWRWKDGQYTDDANTATINAWSDVSAKVWTNAFERIQLSLAVDNILDEKHMESDTDECPGRTLTAALSWQF